jgi:hypothetical protein
VSAEEIIFTRMVAGFAMGIWSGLAPDSGREGRGRAP